MIVITFAMGEESKDFLPLLENRRERTPDKRHDLPVIEGTLAGIPLTVVHLGVGGASAAMRLSASGVFAGPQQPRLLICPGYGGGLAPHLAHADLLLVENFSAPALLEKAAGLVAGEGVHRGNLTSEMVVIESAADKAALAQKTGTVCVDMETAAVAELCRRHEVPMLAFRIISDDAHTTLPVPGYLLWDLDTQKPPLAKLLWHLATHPSAIAGLMHMLESLPPVRARLTETLKRLIPAL